MSMRSNDNTRRAADGPHPSPAASDGVRHLPRSRVIEMLNNYADGTYQAIDPAVVGLAAKYLQKSKPTLEDADTEIERIMAMTDAECLAAGIAEYGSEAAWRTAMEALRQRLLAAAGVVKPTVEMGAAVHTDATTESGDA